MKLKSLILGSVAAAGLSTAGFAADLGVLTSLDVCDELGLSGLTISSDTNCLQISGGVSYEFAWGDFRSEAPIAHTYDGDRNISVGAAPTDWTSKVEAWLKFVGTASSDFGPAKAVIKIKEVDITRVNRVGAVTTIDADGEADDMHIDEAYVQIGDTTVIMAGRKGSIANLGDDEPFNFLGLYASDAIDGKGVGVDGDTTYLGGHVIQVVSDLGNGITAGIALENLNMDSSIVAAAAVPATTVAQSGSLVGVLSYAGDSLTAHITAAALGILDGTVESWFVHAGATGTFDAFKLRAAVAYWDDFKFTPGKDVLHALVSAEGNFDMFKIALSGEVTNFSGVTDYGVGASIGATVTEGVSINVGGRYFTSDSGVGVRDTYQVAAQLIAAVTETIKITAEVGGYFGNEINFHHGESVFYGAAELAWAPGGGFTSSIKGEANSESAYKVTFKAAKTFE